MGNTIVNPSDLSLNTTTQLGKFIQNWALNNYNIHPDAVSKYPKKFVDSLKKRACCTYTPNVGIGIAGVNNFGIAGVNPNKIVQYKVVISPFTDNNGNPSSDPTVLSESNCALTNDTGIGQNFLDNEANKNIGINGTLGCKNFYDKDSSNNSPGFAQYVLRNRSNDDSFPSSLIGKSIMTDTTKLYTNPLGDQITGLSPDTWEHQTGNNNGGVLNPYVDCNCVNSVYAVHSELFRDAAGNQIKPQTLAQTLDGNCVSSGISWKGEYDKKDNICYNLINTAGITSADSGNVNLSQSCNGGISPTPSSSQETPSNNSWLYIGGCIVLFIILIIIFLMFSGGGTNNV